MKDKAFVLTNTTIEDYKSYCQKRCINASDRSNRAKFFYDVLHGKVVREKKSGKLIFK